jgi:hypothetical protein
MTIALIVSALIGLLQVHRSLTYVTTNVKLA